MASSFLRFVDYTQRPTTVSRSPLDKWSARRRDLYLTTHNTYNKKIHASGGIRTHKIRERAAADPRLRRRCHWDRHLVTARNLETFKDSTWKKSSSFINVLRRTVTSVAEKRMSLNTVRKYLSAAFSKVHGQPCIVVWFSTVARNLVSPKRPDQPWGNLSLLSGGYWEQSPSGKAARAWSSLLTPLLPKLRTSEILPAVFPIPSCRAQMQIYLHH